MTRIGLQIPNFTWPGVAPDELFDRIAAVAVAGEQSGFDTIFVMDLKLIKWESNEQQGRTVSPVELHTGAAASGAQVA